VRRALSRAIDRALIIDAYLFGFGEVAAGPVSPAHPWYEPVPAIPFDTAAATALLDSAGWRRDGDGTRIRAGQRLAFELLTVGSGDMALEQMLQAQWRAVGAEVRIRQMELATFLELAQGPARDFDALVTGIPGDLALSHVAALYDGDGPLTYPGYRGAVLADAFTRLDRADDEAALVSAWREVQRVLARDEPTAWIYHARGVQGKTRRIGTVRVDLRGELAGIAFWRLDAGPAPRTADRPTAQPPNRRGGAPGRGP
jgi:peptide/nickel transport system substrate-binding protein